MNLALLYHCEAPALISIYAIKIFSFKGFPLLSGVWIHRMYTYDTKLASVLQIPSRHFVCVLYFLERNNDAFHTAK